MNRFNPEPPHTHGDAAHTAVLLVNLGTPEAPTAAAVRTYLKQFLSDPRVVEIPSLLWQPILRGIVLNTRPAKSAQKYAKIWTKDGSPLKTHTAKQAKLLKGRLGEAGLRGIEVDYAMRYGQPAIADVLDRLRSAGARRILIVPLYPQYAASSSGSVFDAVAAWGQRCRNLPELRFVRNFHDRPDYIAALAASVREHWQANGRGQQLLISFHGLPRRSLDLGDPYFCECQKTGRLLAEALGLTADEYRVTFQSRFGRAKWLQPYTQPTLEQLAQDGVGRVDVICPSFVADCLETLEEIAIECRAAFLAKGGKELRTIPCLNERADWIDTLADLVSEHLGSWRTPLPTPDPVTSARAKGLGAKTGMRETTVGVDDGRQ
jgi:protoporphyrin/coproporphyrin ferrochelatase